MTRFKFSNEKIENERAIRMRDIILPLGTSHEAEWQGTQIDQQSGKGRIENGKSYLVARVP